jgi:hypothetical protein
MMRLVLLLTVSLLAGCSTEKVMSSSPSYMSSMAYYQRDAITESLFLGDQAVLDDAAVDRILTSRIIIPDASRVAVLRLGDRSPWRWYSEDLQRMDEETVRRVTQRLASCPRIADVMLLRSLLTPERKDVPVLREAAACCQAHLLLVYQPSIQSYGSRRFLAPDEVKAWCVIEAALLDVRTGIVPWTGTSVRSFVTRESKHDSSLGETMRKAELTAQQDALTEIAEDPVAFINALPSS